MANTTSTTVWLQSFAVTGAPSDQNYSQNQVRDASGNTYMSLVKSANVAVSKAPTMQHSRDQLLRTSFASTALIFYSELDREYVELGNALREMTLLTDDNEWTIGTAVYQVACQVAAELQTRSFPAPQVFSHGATSVVFNWSAGRNNLYLTIGSDHISALSSTVERIQRRVEFSRKELTDSGIVTKWLLAAPTNQPVVSEPKAASQFDASVS